MDVVNLCDDEISDFIDLEENTDNENKNKTPLHDKTPGIPAKCDVTQVISLKLKKEYIKHFDRILKENPVLAEVIEKCLTLENTGGMLRIINKRLITLYDEAKAYTKKDLLQSKIIQALNLLKKHPSHKYSHIKCLCDFFKNQIRFRKRRVELHTISSNVSGCKKIKTDTQLLTGRSIDYKTNNGVIDLDDDNNDIIVIEDGKYSNDVSDEVKKVTEPPENVDDNQDMLSIKGISLFHNSDLYIKIKSIEDDIASYKVLIDKLEKEEVYSDCEFQSSYIQCAKLKEKVVFLYSKLCELTNTQPVKQRTVRLAVINGHPPGPVKLLEDLINSKNSGVFEPHFPDFTDVVKCVAKAIDTDKLNWNTNQILGEARSLFIQCGRALQKQRMKREWRHLLSCANEEQLQDPAEDDPELEARLEANRLLASKKLDEIMTWYTSLQSGPTRKSASLLDIPGPRQLKQTQKNRDTIEIEIDFNTPLANQKNPKDNYDTNNQCNVNPCNGHQNDKHINVQQTKDNTVSNNTISVTYDKTLNNTNEVVINKTVDKRLIINKDSSNINDISNDIELKEKQIKMEILGDYNETNTDNISSNDTKNDMANTSSKDLSAANEKQIKIEFLVNRNDLDTNFISSLANSTEPNINNTNVTDNQTVHKNIAKPNGDDSFVIKPGFIKHEILVNHNGYFLSNDSIENDSDNFTNDSRHIVNTSKPRSNDDAEHMVTSSDEPVRNDGSPVEGSENFNVISPKEIKKEPSENLQNMLDSLGENYMTSVENVEDPFLIIDISDSSSDEE